MDREFLQRRASRGNGFQPPEEDVTLRRSNFAPGNLSEMSAGRNILNQGISEHPQGQESQEPVAVIMQSLA